MAVTINGTTGIANDGGYTGDGVVFADTTPANTLVTTTGGNVGIGTSSPSAKLEVSDTTSASATALVQFTGQNGYEMNVQSLTTTNSTVGARYNFAVNSSNGEFSWSNSGGERARIDSSGNLLVGTTTSRGKLTVESSSGACRAVNVLTGTGTIDAFTFNGGAIGSITTNGVSTSYVTSSDYRLKNTIAPMTGALAKVAALKPCTYKWNSDGSDGEGFIAHELQDVCPSAVSGEKDAVNEDGSIKPQGIDTSFLVATLTAAIQELKAIVDAQGAEIAALKGTQP